MKIAFIVETCSAGVGRHVIDAALCHAGAGHSMHLLHSWHGMDTRFSEGLKRVVREGGRVAGFDIGHKPAASDYSAIKQVRRYLIQHGPFDVVHCHSTKAGLVGRLSALRLGARVIYTPHAFFSMSPENGLAGRSAIRLLEFSLSLISDAIICVSQEELDHAVGLGIAPFKLHVVPNGIDERVARRAKLRRAEMRRRFGLAQNDVCIGFVGRLAPQKDPQLLLAAFLRIIAELPPDVRLVLVGDGPLMPDLTAMAGKAGVNDRVHLAGEIDGLTAMSAFDVFALPSRYEGFPYVLLEALAMSLPVVATAAGGVRAMIADGENGFVVPPQDVDRFAHALLQVATLAGLREQMTEFARRRSARFSLSRMVSETEMVYRLSSPNVALEVNQQVASRSAKSAITD
jgi:glycosyltransferase involved in cell wall biosynthesis